MNDFHFKTWTDLITVHYFASESCTNDAYYVNKTKSCIFIETMPSNTNISLDSFILKKIEDDPKGL